MLLFVVPVLLFVVPVAPKCCFGATGVLFRHCRSFITAVRELILLEVSKTSYHSPRRCIYRQDRAESRPLSIDVAFLAEITGMLRRALSLLVS